jgi:hypothetical protein
VNTVSHAEKASESSLPTPVLTKLRPDTASKRHGVCSFFALPAFNKGRSASATRQWRSLEAPPAYGSVHGVRKGRCPPVL